MIFLLVLIVLVESKPDMEPFVVGGDLAAIEYFPHSVFLSVRDYQGAFICGASILNQKVILSAGHCFEACYSPRNIYAYVGNAHKSKGLKYQAANFVIHENYDANEVRNDIGLVVLRVALMLGKTVKRVSIMRRPPPKKVGVVAGWGLIDEVKGIKSNLLHSSKQKLWTFAECSRILSHLPTGSFCAGDMTDKSYASEGDSGSALVINGYIQIGLVSFKRPDISKGLVVYTNVSYHYTWIQINSRNLYCGGKSC